MPLGLGIVGVVELGLRPERVQHPQHAPVTTNRTRQEVLMLHATSTDDGSHFVHKDNYAVFFFFPTHKYSRSYLHTSPRNKPEVTLKSI